MKKGRTRSAGLLKKCVSNRLTTTFLIGSLFTHTCRRSHAKQSSRTTHLTTAAAVVGSLSFAGDDYFTNSKNSETSNNASLPEIYRRPEFFSNEDTENTYDLISSKSHETGFRLIFEEKDIKRGILWKCIQAILCFLTSQVIQPILSSLLLAKNQVKCTTKLLVNLYLFYLETNPLITKSFTAAFIQGVGDFLSQHFERKLQSYEKSSVHEVSYDYQRTLAISSEGILISGPMMHLAYDAFESILPISESDGLMGWLITVIHVAADTFIMDTFFVLSAMVVSGILEGLCIRNQLIPQIHKEFISTTQAAWKSSFLLCPLQLACFRFLPVSLRVMAMNLQDIIWNAVVSYMIHTRRQKHIVSGVEEKKLL